MQASSVMFSACHPRTGRGGHRQQRARGVSALRRATRSACWWPRASRIGTPNFWCSALRRNTNVDLTAVYRLNATRHRRGRLRHRRRDAHGAGPFPAHRRRDEQLMTSSCWAARRRRFLTTNTESLLNDFVNRRGGSVVFARGKPYGGRFQPLAEFRAGGLGRAAQPAPSSLRPTDAGREIRSSTLAPPARWTNFWTGCPRSTRPASR